MEQLSSYIYVDLENSKSDTIIIRVGINDLLNGSNEIQIDSLIQNIGAVIEKCRFSGKKIQFYFWFSIYYYGKIVDQEETDRSILLQ